MATKHSTGAILYNRQGQILLQLRDDKPELAYPNCWTTLGGAMEPGESPDDAIRRELLEEIGRVPDLTLWREWDRLVHWKQVTTAVHQYVYVGLVDWRAEDITLMEGQAVQYFGLDDLEHIAIAFDFETMFRQFFEELTMLPGGDTLKE